MSEKIITIQPQHRDDGVLPYPFHIEEDGSVGRQDVWHGNPERLVGFQKSAKRQDVDLPLSAFLADPQKAKGMFPVMEDSKGRWATHMGAIETVEVWDRAEQNA